MSIERHLKTIPEFTDGSPKPLIWADRVVITPRYVKVPIEGIHSPDSSRFPRNIKKLLKETYTPEIEFAQALKSWESDFDAERLGEALMALGKSESLNSVSDDFGRIVKLRKKGTTLISAWKMLSASHTCPKPFSNFVNALGELKDQTNEWEPRKEASSQALNRLEKYVLSLENQPQFEPASFKSFYRHYREVLGEVEEIANKEIISITEFHLVRRRMRRIKKYYELIEARAESPEIHQVNLYLEKICGTMGRLQDIFVKLHQQGRIDEDVHQTELHPVTRTMIRTFIYLHSAHKEQKVYIS
jgi:hypothetical protein